MATSGILHKAGNIPKRPWHVQPFTGNHDDPVTQKNDMNGELFVWKENLSDLSREFPSCATVLDTNKQLVFTMGGGEGR